MEFVKTAGFAIGTFITGFAKLVVIMSIIYLATGGVYGVATHQQWTSRPLGSFSLVDIANVLIGGFHILGWFVSLYALGSTIISVVERYEDKKRLAEGIGGS